MIHLFYEKAVHKLCTTFFVLLEEIASSGRIEIMQESLKKILVKIMP